MSSYKRSNSETAPYLKPQFWVDNVFWEDNSHTEKAKKYFRKWREGQRKLAERRCKEDAIS